MCFLLQYNIVILSKTIKIMEKREKRPYNKWSESAKRIVDVFIDTSNNNTLILQSVLGIVEGFERTESTICWQLSKQCVKRGVTPPYTTCRIKV
jgi:hypothetical protein